MKSAENTLEVLKKQWDHLCRDCPAEATAKVFAEVTKKYAQPHRKYHNLDHIRGLLTLIDSHAEALTASDTLRFAAWFHDVVYDPYRTTNERKSAELAIQAMQALGLPETVGEYTADIIQRTARHHGEDADSDTQFFLDADLSILGSPPEVYQAYAQAIREEYRFVPEQVYTAGRKKILQGFLAREFIYFTAQMRKQFEATARKNLKEEIEKLG